MCCYDENTSFYKPEKGREAQQYFIYLTTIRFRYTIPSNTFVKLVFDRFWKEEVSFVKIRHPKRPENNIREESKKYMRIFWAPSNWNGIKVIKRMNNIQIAIFKLM
jgi:hypothetical protein